MATQLPTTGVKEDVWIPTACDMCYNACTVRVHRVDGVAVKVEGIPEAGPNYGATCAKGLSALMNVYSPNRVTAPMVRTNPEKGVGVDPGWKEISWDEAMDLFVEKIRAAREVDPRSIMGLTFDRVPTAMLRAFLVALGSPNLSVGSAGFFCGNGTHPVAFMLTGANDVHPDLEHCNYLLMFGTSYGFVAQMNAMGLARHMADARMRGMKLTVVDPALSYAASQADEWVPIRPGTDTALALSMMREWVIEGDRFDKAFVRRYTNGPYLIGSDGRYVRHASSGKPLVGLADGRVASFDAAPADQMVLEGSFTIAGEVVSPSFVAFRNHLAAYTPERASEITSVPASTIRRLAREMLEAAQIGQTISLGGEMLPLRPAAACWYRGISAHKHAMLNGMAIGHLDVLLGAVDVPGGLLNSSGSGPDWQPKSDPDGLQIPGNPYARHGMKSSLPRRDAAAPESVFLNELFPVAISAAAGMYVGMTQGPQLGLPYEPQVLIQCRDNVVATGGDPVATVEAFKSIPFVVSMNTFHDETSELADLLLPDTHALERTVPLVSNPLSHYVSATLPFEHYTWNAQQPIIKAVPQARHWSEVLLDAAARLDILPDVYTTLNGSTQISGAYRLERDGAYTWEEISDRWMKSVCGEEHGLDYFREHGYYQSDVVRGPRAAYPRSYYEARIPLYLEHFIDAGETVKAYTEARGVAWDTSDYTALVDWKPCLGPEDAPPGFDVWVVNQKLPFMTFSHSGENPWLMDLAKRNTKVFNVGINRATAAQKGIREGDRIVLETPAGRRAEGLARLTEGIHPECIAVPGVVGRWAAGNRDAIGRGIHFNSLLTHGIEHMDTLTTALDSCVRVRISRR
jgi:molybdopterin-containing oxidoreductase family molybdopterin binding subunit